jgi:hypothetical protein
MWKCVACPASVTAMIQSLYGRSKGGNKGKEDRRNKNGGKIVEVKRW